MQSFFVSIIAGFTGFVLSGYWFFTQIEDVIERIGLDLEVSWFWSILLWIFTLFLMAIFWNILSENYRKFSMREFLRQEPWGKALMMGAGWVSVIAVFTLLHEYYGVDEDIIGPLLPVALLLTYILGNQYKKHQSVGVVFFLISALFIFASTIGLLYLYAKFFEGAL